MSNPIGPSPLIPPFNPPTGPAHVIRLAPPPTLIHESPKKPGLMA